VRANNWSDNLHGVAVLDAHAPDDHSSGSLFALLDVKPTQLVAEHVGGIA